MNWGIIFVILIKTIANRIPSPVKVESTISLTPILLLIRVLLVPNLNCNLLSVGRLLDSLHCFAHFYSTYCFFQYLNTLEVIGCGKRVGRLYILTIEGTIISGSSNHSVLSAKVVDKHQMWLWECRSRHPSFHYLNVFPSMFPTCSDS